AKEAAVAAATAAEDAAESLREEKASLEAQLQEAAEDAARSKEVLAATVSGSAASSEEAAGAASKGEEERTALEGQVASQKEKLKRAAAKLRSLREERDTTIEKLASASALLETSEKNLSDAEARSRSLEETHACPSPAANLERFEQHRRPLPRDVTSPSLPPRLSDGVLSQMAASTSSLREADERSQQASEECTRLRQELEELRQRSEEATREELRRAEESAAARITALEAELDKMQASARQLESVKEGSARESEEIMGVLQGQVDAANKASLDERDAAKAGLEAAEEERDNGKTRLKELFAKYKTVQAVRG
ncbi:unnamed protein product, partial [Scytosiphon promiscuus]